MSEGKLNPSVQTPASGSKVGEDFSEDYANNFTFAMSAWDFKILFGELDQTKGPDQINWHTSITMPWGVAKILSSFLYLNIVAYEMQNGIIAVPASVLPEFPSEPVGPEDTPQARSLYRIALRLHQRLLGLMPPDTDPEAR